MHSTRNDLSKSTRAKAIELGLIRQNQSGGLRDCREIGGAGLNRI